MKYEELADYEQLQQLSTDELLARTQTNITEDPRVAIAIAELVLDRPGITPIERCTANRQAGFRSEQAGDPMEVVQNWFKTAREVVSWSRDLAVTRHLTAVDLLEGRALTLRMERTGDTSIKSRADKAFEAAEIRLLAQHKFGERWDRFGTMNSRHLATKEAMSGDTLFAAITASRGIWRAIRAKKEGTPEPHRTFVTKQVGVNAAAGALALSHPLGRIPAFEAKRHKIALRLLGD